MNLSVKTYLKDGKCSGCGRRCGNFLPLSPKEAKTIRDHVRREGILPRRTKKALSRLEQDLTCPFRDCEKKICAIYKVRPWICRAYDCGLSIEQFTEKMPPGKMDIYDMRQSFFGRTKEHENLLIRPNDAE